MKNFKYIIKKIFFIPLPALVLIWAAAFPVCITALTYEKMPFPLKYAAYTFSAYALATFVINFKRTLQTIKKIITQSHIYKLLRRNKITRRFLSDFHFKNTVSLYQGLVINTLYSLFRLIAAIFYSSAWFGAIAVYYFIMGFIRLTLIRGIKIAEKKSGNVRILSEYKSYRLCGVLMFALNIGITGMAIQMIRDNLHYEYPGVIIYLSAAYTFYTITLAIINLVKARKTKSPILAASKALSFATALMSVFVLQTAMIAQFGGDPQFRQIMNMLTGSAVCFATFAIAIFMIAKSVMKIRKLRTE